ncbi:MAG TPA: hypothetical protein VFH56_05555 [Acidimicrobiales bacterium]|nr:hypothetical protein [Acidimicrobiales bacterium]
MAGQTKNDILMQVEDAISALSAPDGRHAVDVLLANRSALVILDRIATELGRGAYERDKQARRKERLRQQAVAGQTPLFDV